MALPALDLQPGLDLQASIWRKFGLPVNARFGCENESFLLVASIGRCNFKLSEGSVALLLQACLGGSAPAFRVLELSDRVFQFTVRSKKVAFSSTSYVHLPEISTKFSSISGVLEDHHGSVNLKRISEKKLLLGLLYP